LLMTFLNNLLPVANSRGEVPDFNRSSQRVERKKEHKEHQSWNQSHEADKINN
jgi:hypothetical protein